MSDLLHAYLTGFFYAFAILGWLLALAFLVSPLGEILNRRLGDPEAER